MDSNHRRSGVPVVVRRKERSQAVVRSGGSAPGSGWIETRARLAKTRLDYKPGGRRGAAAEGYPSVTARRNAFLARRRRWGFAFLLVASLIFFPAFPVWLIGWLYYRSRPAQKSMRRVRQGVKALEKEQVGIALQRLQEAHLQDPANNDALYWLGLLLADQRRYDEATEALSLLSERVPGLPEVEAALLDAHHDTGDPESAIHHAQRLLDLDPYNLDALVKLADSFEALGRPDVAVETLRHAPLYKRTLDDGLKNVHYRLGTLYERRGDVGKALDHYRRVYAADVGFQDVAARLEALERGGMVS